MPLTLLRHVVQKPPVGPLELIAGHPLASGLVFATPLHETGSNEPMEYVSAARPSAQVINWVGTAYGPSPDFNGSSRYIRYTDNPIWRPGTSPFTIMVLANPISGGSTIGLFSKRNGTNFDQLSLMANCNNNGGPQSGTFGWYHYDTTTTNSGCTAATSIVDGAFHQVVLTRVGATHTLYRDGVNMSLSQANTGNPNWNGNPSLYLGALGNTNAAPTGAFLNGQIVYAYYWVGRALSQGEILSLMAEPYQMFRTRPIQRWFVIAAAGGTTYLRTVSASQGQSASLVKQANLTRALTQAETVSLAKQAQLSRVVTQAQSISLAKSASVVRVTTQTQSVSAAKQAILSRTVPQAQAATITTLRVILRTVSVVQAQSVSLVKQTQLTRVVVQAQQVSAQRTVGLMRSAVQVQSAALRNIVRLVRGVVQQQAATVAAVFIPSPGSVVPAAILTVVARQRAFVAEMRTRILEVIGR